ncbi:lipopolysaccharide transport periplasmic protein LptA [uncultured Sulfitobacter sp.]|uniref:lipopolysaccharide transport periplasmic protein LptA n=1 Tax=uncultured Sulfitobacter sp. TaxID=191468 RepID=UPI00261D7B5D|nr:lipopolysaccharide transport periplasmic protein LptA [uncultured Sulfitobacter sp.]
MGLRLTIIALFVACLSTLAVAQGASVAFGTIAQDTSLPVEVTSEELSVDQQTGTAIFSGNVVIGQGEMRLSAQRVLVVYRTDANGIAKMEATGGVTLVSGPDAAEAQRADYSIDDGTIVMSGDVLLAQGASALSADSMTIRLEDGTAQMSGNVRTRLQTGPDQ